jgi:hypothetical protein
MTCKDACPQQQDLKLETLSGYLCRGTTFTCHAIIVIICARKLPPHLESYVIQIVRADAWKFLFSPLRLAGPQKTFLGEANTAASSISQGHDCDFQP